MYTFSMPGTPCPPVATPLHIRMGNLHWKCSRIPDDKTVINQSWVSTERKKITTSGGWLQGHSGWGQDSVGWWESLLVKKYFLFSRWLTWTTPNFQIRPLTQQNLAWEVQMSHQEHLFLERFACCFQTKICCKWASDTQPFGPHLRHAHYLPLRISLRGRTSLSETKKVWQVCLTNSSQ